MSITRRERRLLVTMPANSLESRLVRQKLRDAGRDWCRCCDRVKPFDAFGKVANTATHPTGRQGRCLACTNTTKAKVPRVPDRAFDEDEKIARRRPDFVRLSHEIALAY